MELSDIPRAESNEDEERDESTESSKEARIAARRKRVMAKIEAEKRAAQGQEPETVSFCNYITLWWLLWTIL